MINLYVGICEMPHIFREKNLDQRKHFLALQYEHCAYAQCCSRSHIHCMCYIWLTEYISPSQRTSRIVFCCGIFECQTGDSRLCVWATCMYL